MQYHEGGILNIHKLTYSAFIYRVMCVSITATNPTSLNMSTISNICLKVLLLGDNTTNIFYISISSAAVKTQAFGLT